MRLKNDQLYMQQALDLALRGKLTVSPNPMVGCVIVKDGVMIGEGYHVRAGEGHAEINALSMAGSAAEGATAYVSLEPCCHTGRTPPCTKALIKAGIHKVVVACLDPNPLVAGKGVLALQNAGIDVEIGLMREEATTINKVFFHYVTKKRPYIIAKWAMSLDGRTITHPNDSRSISHLESLQHAHNKREQVDAIIIGRNTAIADNPELTVRHVPHQPVKQPLKIIVTSCGNLPVDLKLLEIANSHQTIVVATNDISTDNRKKIESCGAEVLITNANAHGYVDLHHLLAQLASREIASIVVEGGRKLHDCFFQENLVDEIDVYIAPVIIGEVEKKIPVNIISTQQLQTDFYFNAHYKNNKLGDS